MKNNSYIPNPGPGFQTDFEKIKNDLKTPDPENIPQSIPRKIKINYGSGGNYLSNEIFYRVARARGTNSVKTGHFHVAEPNIGSNPFTAIDIINEVKNAIKRCLSN